MCEYFCQTDLHVRNISNGIHISQMFNVDWYPVS